jgi:hypothetical protein
MTHTPHRHTDTHIGTHRWTDTYTHTHIPCLGQTRGDTGSVAHGVLPMHFCIHLCTLSRSSLCFPPIPSISTLSACLCVCVCADDADGPSKEEVERAAETLYGLIHARYILTNRGLQKMVRGRPSVSACVCKALLECLSARVCLCTYVCVSVWLGPSLLYI